MILWLYFVLASKLGNASCLSLRNFLCILRNMLMNILHSEDLRGHRVSDYVLWPCTSLICGSLWSVFISLQWMKAAVRTLTDYGYFTGGPPCLMLFIRTTKKTQVRRRVFWSMPTLWGRSALRGCCCSETDHLPHSPAPAWGPGHRPAYLGFCSHSPSTFLELLKNILWNCIYENLVVNIKILKYTMIQPLIGTCPFGVCFWNKVC